jgi:hypothetical protein
MIACSRNCFLASLSALLVCACGGSKGADSANTAAASTTDSRDASASAASAASADSGAAMDAGAPKPRGKLPPDVVQKIIKAGFPGMAQCYAAGLARTPGLAGTVNVRFVIDVDGHVSEAAESTEAPTGTTQFDAVAPSKRTAAVSRFPDAEVTKCVVGEFANLKFPKPEGGGTVAVVYPVVFKAK